MERPINDFDEDVFRLIGGDIAEENDESNVIEFYDPLSPILNRRRMKATDDDDYFGETPAFI